MIEKIKYERHNFIKIESMLKYLTIKTEELLSCILLDEQQ